MLQPEPSNPDSGTPPRGCEELSAPVLDGDFPEGTQVSSADSDSSRDEGSLQEDIARLRRQVEDHMSTAKFWAGQIIYLSATLRCWC